MATPRPCPLPRARAPPLPTVLPTTLASAAHYVGTNTFILFLHGPFLSVAITIGVPSATILTLSRPLHNSDDCDMAVR